MAVVRAGDADPSHLEGSEFESGVHTEPLPESRRAHLELSEDISSRASGDRITPLSIPPPPALPNDLVQTAGSASSPHKVFKGAAQSATAQSPSSLAGAAISKEPAASRRKYGSVAIALALVAALAAVLGIMHGRDRTARKTPAAPSAVATVSSRTLTTSEASEQAPSAAVAVEAAPIAGSAAAPSKKSDEPNEPPAKNATRVTLELMPIDAKVFVHGHEIPGPPFAFDVPIGKRLAIEVKRPGFATAKVVLDGKKPLVHFGMLRDTHH